MESKQREALIAHLGQFVTENKREKIAQVLSQRTRYITTVLEDIYQSHNASATVRTADCMGLQEINIIENYNDYEVNRDVTMGAAKWVDIRRFNAEETNNTEVCFAQLRKEGFRIVGTSLSAESLHPAELPMDKPLALVFGNEEHGLSEYAQAHTDLNLKIPMYGFTQSFNISVSVSIALTHLVRKLFDSDIDWQLSAEDKLETTLQWYRRIVARSEVIETEFIKKNLP